MFRRLSVTAALVAVAMTAAGPAAFGGTVTHGTERADRGGRAEAAATRITPPRSARNALNIVIIGQSTQTPDPDDARRGDVVMVLHIAGDGRSMHLVQFPRASYLSERRAEQSDDNDDLAARLTVDTIERLTRTDMDHVVLTDIEGFTQLAADLGPITLQNPIAFTNFGVTFPAGTITLQGRDGLAYTRARQDNGDAVGQREQRQALLIEAGLRKAFSAEVLTNPVRLLRLISSLNANATLDRQLTFRRITRILLSLGINQDSVTLLRAPITAADIVFRGSRVERIETPQFEALSEALEDDTMAEYLEEYPNPVLPGQG